MLNFFRKYQRSFFLVTSVVVIVSFVFFGTYDRRTAGEPVYQDKEIGHLYNGSSLSERDLKLFSQFLSSSRHTASFERSFVNVLNDGVFTEDFLKTKLIHILTAQYFDKLKPELEERLEKIKRYVPYQHEEAPFLSAKYMWQHYSPGLFENLEKICAKTEVDEEFLTLLVDLYLAQVDFPGEYLKKVLTYNQSQYSWIRPDSRLNDEDFALFGFHSLSDWFGEGIVDMVSQFVMNAAVYSEQMGFKVSNQEAKESMLFNIAKLKSKEPINYKTVLQFLGFQEKKAIDIWKKVLLFRRVFNNLSESALLDSQSIDAFSTYALEKANIDLYQMQKPFVFSEFTDLLKFQLYVENVSNTAKTNLLLPKDLLSVSAVENKTKELVKNTYKVEMSKIDLNKQAALISIKDMQNWQLDQDNWHHLVSIFHEISDEADQELRFVQLDSLDTKKRAEIDRYSRNQILMQKDKELENTLKTQGVETTTIEVFANGQTNLSGIRDGDKMALFLENTDGVGVYKQDSSWFYFNILSKEKTLLSFSEALNNGALDRMLDALLEKEYEKLQQTSPQNFKNEKGEFKALAEVKDLVGVYHFSYLLKAIDEDCNATSWIKGMGPKEFYTKHRFQKHLQQTRNSLLKQDTSGVLQGESTSLVDQWKLVKNEQEVKKAEAFALNEEIFSSELNVLSDVLPAENTVSFFEVKEKSIDDEAKNRQRQKALEALSLSMKEELTRKMLKKIEDKSSITFIGSY